jgi:transcriptional regulator with XRE-family HTH domain
MDQTLNRAPRSGKDLGGRTEPPSVTVAGMGAKSMRYESSFVEHDDVSELTVLVWEAESESAVPKSNRIRVLRGTHHHAAAERAPNLFVLVSAINLPEVSTLVSHANRRNQLRALFIREDKNTSWLPHFLERAGIRILRNTLVHTDDTIPRRVLSAWSIAEQNKLIADATVSDDRLFVISCALKRFEVPFERFAALRDMPNAERSDFTIQPDGAYIHWPRPDVHLDLEAIRVAIDPGMRRRATRIKAHHDERYGQAIAMVRQKHGLKQSDIEGLSERQVRRIEKGEGTTVQALERLAQAHGISLQDYLTQLADTVGIPSIKSDIQDDTDCSLNPTSEEAATVGFPERRLDRSDPKSKPLPKREPDQRLQLGSRPSTIGEILSTLPPTGPCGFEGLVRRLLEELSGLRFHLARSGDQHGRDARANRPTGGSVALECKRYHSSSPLEGRELIAELQQAHASLPSLDLWILAASREISDQILSGLEPFGREHGIDILALDCLRDGGGNLDILCGAYPSTVAEFLSAGEGAPPSETTLQALSQEASRPGFDAKLQNLEAWLLQPSRGWPMWQARAHGDWLNLMRTEGASRAHFGQALSVLAPNSRAVSRRSIDRELEAWWENDRTKVFALLGDEGDGKTWAVAQWLTKKVEEKSLNFPPIIFFSSREAGDAKKLGNLIEATLKARFGDHEWQHRVSRWLESPGSRGDLPLAVIVLDGLNERQLPSYWRALIESSLDPEWQQMISIICTARTGFWKEHFGSLDHLPVIVAILSPFSDEEVDCALHLRGKSLPEFPEDLRPLLRKPRYLDLVTRYSERVVQSGDFTIARLFFEDWRDKNSRRDREMSDDAFSNLLRQMAEQYHLGKPSLRTGDLEAMLPPDSDGAAAIRELATGGVLASQGCSWVVSGNRLPLGLGLLLCDQLRKVDSKSRNVQEEIASWLEPHTGSDFEGLIIEYALLAAVGVDATQVIISELLLAWINTQNPRSPKGSPIERRLCAYLPQATDAYFEVAEVVWSTKGDQPWAQEVLLRGLIHWVGESQKVRARVVPVIERWMGMVPIQGPPIKREAGNAGRAEDLGAPLRELFGKVHAGETHYLAGYALTMISDDGWLRLAHVSLAIISSLYDRRPHIRAIVAGVLAGSVSDHPDKADEMEWVIRSSRIPLEEEINLHVRAMWSDGNKVTQKSIARLLNYVGTDSAWIERNRLDLDSLFPTPDWLLEVRKNPVESIFSCTAKDLQDYCRRETFRPWSFIRSAVSMIADPELELPNDLSDRLSPVVEHLHRLKIWQSRSRTGEDLQLEESEGVLARLNPKGIGEVVRGIVKAAEERPLEALAALAWRLDDYDLLLDAESRQVLWKILSSNPVFSSLNQDIAKQVECHLFQAVLPLWNGNEQLMRLLRRSEDGFDLRDFQWAYRGPVQPPVDDPTSDRGRFRLLHYLGTLRANVLSDEQITRACIQQDSLVRGGAFRYLDLCDFDKKRTDKLLIDWKWNPDQHFLEQTYGSLLLIDSMRRLSGSDWVDRVDPSYRATALHVCHADQKAWIDHAHWLDETLRLLAGAQVFDGLPSVHVGYSSREPNLPGDVYLPQEASETIRFVRPESTWGGRFSEGRPNLGTDPEITVERRKAQYEELRRRNVTAASAGNYWLHRSFPTDGFGPVIEVAPEMVSNWAAAVTTGTATLVPPQASSFYVGLTEVLLRHVDWQRIAVALYRAVKRSQTGVRLIETGTQLDHLDHVLFDSPASSELLELWNERYELCTTDKDLLDLALLVRSASRSDAMTWYKQLLDARFASGVPFDFAKAAALRGFVEEDPNATWMQLVIEDEAPWVKEVISTAQERVHSEQRARYWFKRFCSFDDLDSAWAGFRLYLRCVDRRCWLWSRLELEGQHPGNRKEGFFELNIHSIERACRENEKKLSESFLNCKVNEGLSPWMA